MKIGAWIHDNESAEPLEQTIIKAAAEGLQSIRCYHLGYAEKAANALRVSGLTLLAGLHVDAAGLVEDWRSQVRIDEISRYLEMGLDIEGFCVGNELREGGDQPDRKQFTSRLSFGLARLLDAYREWMVKHGSQVPLTYAMEGLVFDGSGGFKDHLWPLIDACDIVSINSYPMSDAQWFGWGAFEESRRFLSEPRYQNLRFATYELRLRNSLEQLSAVGKPVVLSETGFPSASGYEMTGEKDVRPVHDNAGFFQAMKEFLGRIRAADEDYDGIIKSIYFYEWRDNYQHAKIWNVEQSPIHTSFGLCDAEGKPKFALKDIL